MRKIIVEIIAVLLLLKHPANRLSVFLRLIQIPRIPELVFIHIRDI
jgi:hypothetical protein